MLDIGSEIGTKLPPKATTDKASRVQQSPLAEKSAIKTGTIIVLSPTALKLSRELQAIQSNPDMEPEARFDASQKLRQLALKVFTGD